MNNNPPDVILELTTEEAERVLASCSSNMTMALKMMRMIKDKKILEQMIKDTETFRSVRRKLLDQKVEER